MNFKKLAITIGAVFITVFVSDFVIHGQLLKGMYMDTAPLWRSDAEMQSFMGWMVLAQLMFATFFCMIFPFGREGRGMTEGVRYGLLMGGFASASHVAMYSVMPMPFTLMIAWVFCSLIQSVLCGMVVNWIWSSEKVARRRA